MEQLICIAVPVPFFGTALYSACEFVSLFASIRFLNRLLKIPFTSRNLLIIINTHDRLFARLYLWFYASDKDKNTTVRISVKSCIYGWKIVFKIDFYSSDL